METVKTRWDLVVNLAVHRTVKIASKAMNYPRSSYDRRLRKDKTMKEDVKIIRANPRIKAAKEYLMKNGFYCIPEDGIYQCRNSGLKLFFNGLRFFFLEGPREYYFEIRNHLKRIKYWEDVNGIVISVFNPL